MLGKSSHWPKMGHFLLHIGTKKASPLFLESALRIFLSLRDARVYSKESWQ